MRESKYYKNITQVRGVAHYNCDEAFCTNKGGKTSKFTLHGHGPYISCALTMLTMFDHNNNNQ